MWVRSPKYYDGKGAGFLKSFTAGFITTCGLRSVGSPCIDDGEELPLHGTISNIPCENISHWIENDKIHIKAIIRDTEIFAQKLILEREYEISLDKNEICMIDKIKNIGSEASPLEMLYHCNIGHPLLDEDAEISIPSKSVTPRNAHAKSHILNCLNAEEPQNGYEEMCFYHHFEGNTQVGIFNPNIKKGLKINYDASQLECFTQWKMMGEYEYVMGLEPGNCYPDGRDVMREQRKLEFLAPGEEKVYNLKFMFTEE